MKFQRGFEIVNECAKRVTKLITEETGAGFCVESYLQCIAGLTPQRV